MIFLEINNFLVLEGVRCNFCHIFLVRLDIFENFLESVYWCKFDLLIAIASLNKVLKLWVENAPVSMYMWLYEEIIEPYTMVDGTLLSKCGMRMMKNGNLSL